MTAYALYTSPGVQEDGEAVPDTFLNASIPLLGGLLATMGDEPAAQNLRVTVLWVISTLPTSTMTTAKMVACPAQDSASLASRPLEPSVNFLRLGPLVGSLTALVDKSMSRPGQLTQHYLTRCTCLTATSATVITERCNGTLVRNKGSVIRVLCLNLTAGPSAGIKPRQIHFARVTPLKSHLWLINRPPTD
jgi:hypothetical protein